jgi:hypothetical protein
MRAALSKPPFLFSSVLGFDHLLRYLLSSGLQGTILCLEMDLSRINILIYKDFYSLPQDIPAESSFFSLPHYKMLDKTDEIVYIRVS